MSASFFYMYMFSSPKQPRSQTFNCPPSFLILNTLIPVLSNKTMGFHFVKIVNAVLKLGLSSLATNQESSVARKGYCAVYVGENQRKRFVIPIAYLNRAFFKDLLSQTEEEFGYNHPMGGLTIPCNDDTFIDLISHLN